MKKQRNKHQNKKEQNKINRLRLEINKLKEQNDELRHENRELTKQLHMKALTPEKRKYLKDTRADRRLETSKAKNEANANKIPCPKCRGYRVDKIEFKRHDGEFYILFCRNECCKHRTRLLPAESDDNQ